MSADKLMDIIEFNRKCRNSKPIYEFIKGGELIIEADFIDNRSMQM